MCILKIVILYKPILSYPGGSDSVLQPCPLNLRKCSKSWVAFWILLLGLCVGSHSTDTSQTIFSAKPCADISLCCVKKFWKKSLSSRMWRMKMFLTMDCPDFPWRSAVSVNPLCGLFKEVAACLWYLMYFVVICFLLFFYIFLLFFNVFFWFQGTQTFWN